MALELTSAQPVTFDTRTRMLLEAPVLPTLLRLAAPNVLVMFAQMSIGLVEVYFIARLGINALAGVSLVFPILSLIGALSQGAVGGGVVTAIARALGRGKREEASQLVWYALTIAVGFGLLSTIVIVNAGPRFYRAMGADGASLAAATTYSSLIFSGATLIWVFNLLLAAVRGTGNLILPLIVVCGGALLLLPLSPALIFGIGPFPPLGIAGGAVAILAYYAGGSVCFALHLWARGGVLRPSLRPPSMNWGPFLEIFKVGGMSAIVSSTTNLTIAIITGYVGLAGASALAGYGAGARLEFILVPFCYGIGGPAGIMIGTNLGAGQADRALRTAWLASLLVAFGAEVIGVLAAVWPSAWIRAFSDDPAVVEIGVSYLRTVGPFFGLFGLGYALYCIGQGTGRMGWPVLGACMRAAAAVAGGAIVLRTSMNVEYVFIAVSIGMAIFGCLSLPGLILRVGLGVPSGSIEATTHCVTSSTPTIIFPPITAGSHSSAALRPL